MSTLEQHLREAASNGRLKSLTLWSTATGWQGNVRTTSSDGWSVHIAVDPVAALIGALAAPFATRHPPMKTIDATAVSILTHDDDGVFG